MRTILETLSLAHGCSDATHVRRQLGANSTTHSTSCTLNVRFIASVLSDPFRNALQSKEYDVSNVSRTFRTWTTYLLLGVHDIHGGVIIVQIVPSLTLLALTLQR
jgi:hypothetical protein